MPPLPPPPPPSWPPPPPPPPPPPSWPPPPMPPPPPPSWPPPDSPPPAPPWPPCSMSLPDIVILLPEGRCDGIFLLVSRAEPSELFVGGVGAHRQDDFGRDGRARQPRATSLRHRAAMPWATVKTWNRFAIRGTARSNRCASR